MYIAKFTPTKSNLTNNCFFVPIHHFKKIKYKTVVGHYIPQDPIVRIRSRFSEILFHIPLNEIIASKKG